MTPLLIPVAIGCLIVVAILGMGISQMGRGGIEGAKRSNNLMKWRIVAQFGVVVLVAILVAFGMGR